MPSTSPAAEKSHTRNLTLSLIRLLVIILLAIAWVEGTPSLPTPYFAISQVIGYAPVMILVAYRLRTCHRLAKSSGQSGLISVVVLFAFGVLGILSKLTNVIQSDDRNYITMATDMTMLFALYLALGIIESLMRKLATDVPPGVSGEAIQPQGVPIEKSRP